MLFDATIIRHAIQDVFEKRAQVGTEILISKFHNCNFIHLERCLHADMNFTYFY